MRFTSLLDVQFDPSLNIETTDGVYPPSEDTMLLLEAIVVNTQDRVLEIGTGTGFIALHSARVASVIATDVNPLAVELARRNAQGNGLGLAVVRCDMFEGLRGKFDVIVFNPPYLEGNIAGGWIERAWRGGKKGIELTIRFLHELPVHLTTEGRAYLLIKSEQSEVMKTASKHFTVRVVAKRKLFFEELMAVEVLKRKASGSDSNIEKGKETIK